MKALIACAKKNLKAHLVPESTVLHAPNQNHAEFSRRKRIHGSITRTTRNPGRVELHCADHWSIFRRVSHYENYLPTDSFGIRWRRCAVAPDWFAEPPQIALINVHPHLPYARAVAWVGEEAAALFADEAMRRSRRRRGSR